MAAARRKRSPGPPLNDSTRADLFTRLAALLNAGLPMDRALDTAAGDMKQLATATQALKRRLRAGKSLAESARAVGWLAPLDAALVEAAETSGRVGPMLAQLGSWYSERDSRARRTRAGLVLPVGVMVLAAFVKPLPGLVSGALVLGTYLMAVAKVLAVFGLVLLCGWLLIRHLNERNSANANVLDRMRLQVPFLGPHHQRHQVTMLLGAFEMLYSAGITPDRAVAMACTSVGNGCIRESIAPAAAELSKGRGISEVLSASDYLSAQARAVLLSGESSGDLSAALQRYVRQERAELRSTDEVIAAWLPRLVYIGVSIWMVAGIF